MPSITNNVVAFAVAQVDHVAGLVCHIVVADVTVIDIVQPDTFDAIRNDVTADVKLVAVITWRWPRADDGVIRWASANDVIYNFKAAMLRSRNSSEPSRALRSLNRVVANDEVPRV